MVITERLNGTDWKRTYSDLGKSLLQVETGNVYGEAIDHISRNYTYVEVDSEGDLEEISDEEAFQIIADEEPSDEQGEDDISDEEALRIILGEDEEE